MTKTFKQIRENGGGDSGLPTYSYSTSVVVSNKKPKKFESESLIDNVKKAVEIAKKMAGNYTGAVNEIEKIQKGLSKHIRVADALRLANESKDLEEKAEVKWDKAKAGWYDKKGRRRDLGMGATMDLMKKAIDKAKASGDWTSFVNVDKHRYIAGAKEETNMKKEDHDCAKVHPDKPHQEWAKNNLKKAQYETHRYFDVKPGSIESSIIKMKELEETSVTINKKAVDDLVKQYLAKGGTITKLPPVLAPTEPGEKPPKEWDLVKGKSVPGSNQGQKAYKVKKVGNTWKILKAQLREFVRVYNEHFLTNYMAEEFIIEEEK